MARILVVDDAIDRGSLGIRLQRDGCEVVEAHDGETGLAAYAARRPDAVVVDAFLPDMDGETCTGRLLARDPRAEIVMIARTSDESGRRALAGAESMGAAVVATSGEPHNQVVRGLQRTFRLSQVD